MSANAHHLSNTWNIIGNSHLVTQLQQQLQSNTTTHAYLLHGKEHVGKATVAKEFAHALLCTTAATACDSCESCRLVQSQMHPDMLWIGSTEEQPVIPLDTVKSIQHHVSLKPSRARYSIVVIDGAESLTQEAANRLLKILEEPPEHTIFILIAHELHAVLPTIRSRCQLFGFALASRAELLAYAERATKKVDTVMIDLAEQRPGQLVRMLEDKAFYTARKKQTQQAVSFLTEPFFVSSVRLKKYFKKTGSYTERLQLAQQLFSYWELLLHKVLLAKTGSGGAAELQSYKAESLVEALTLSDIVTTARVLSEYRTTHEYNPDVVSQSQHILLSLSLSR